MSKYVIEYATGDEEFDSFDAAIADWHETNSASGDPLTAQITASLSDDSWTLMLEMLDEGYGDYSFIQNIQGFQVIQLAETYPVKLDFDEPRRLRRRADEMERKLSEMASFVAKAKAEKE